MKENFPGNNRARKQHELLEYTGSSTIDYCIASPDLFPHIQDFHVDVPDKSLSDFHSPIILTLKNNANHELEEEIPL